MADTLAKMLDGLTERVRTQYPQQASILAFAIKRSRRDNVDFENATALRYELDGGLLHEGDRILHLLGIADEKHPSEALDLERRVVVALDPDDTSGINADYGIPLTE